jgi:hypothetical protein
MKLPTIAFASYGISGIARWTRCNSSRYFKSTTSLTLNDHRHAFGWAKLNNDERGTLLTRSHKALEGFYGQVDPRLHVQKDFLSESVVWFQLAYHAALLLIHRPFLNEPAGSSTLEFALRSATSAAASISRIVRVYKSHQGFATVAPQVMDYILSAAVIHLLNATSGRTTLGRQSANGIRSCVQALMDMDQKWQVRVQRSIRRIQELANRWRVVWALPISLSQPLSTNQSHQSDRGTSSADVLNHFSDLDTSQAVNPDTRSPQSTLWDPNYYRGALARVDGSWGIMESWDLETLFQYDDLAMGVFNSESG